MPTARRRCRSLRRSRPALRAARYSSNPAQCVAVRPWCPVRRDRRVTMRRPFAVIFPCRKPFARQVSGDIFQSVLPTCCHPACRDRGTASLCLDRLMPCRNDPTRRRDFVLGKRYPAARDSQYKEVNRLIVSAHAKNSRRPARDIAPKTAAHWYSQKSQVRPGLFLGTADRCCYRQG